MYLKFLLTALLIYTITPSTLNAKDSFDGEGLRFIAKATSETTGHIGNIKITNSHGKTKTFSLGSYIIPSENGTQGFAVFKKPVEQIEIEGGDTYAHKLYGYCINVDLPTPDAEEKLSPYSKWLNQTDLDVTYAKEWLNTTSSAPIIEMSEKENASVILKAVENLETKYFKWKEPLEIPDIYPGNAMAVKEGIIQQAVWQLTAALQGNSYSFENFEQSILKQPIVKKFMKSQGSDNTTFEGEPVKNSRYFNYQCQYLWHIINQLNNYVNPASRKLISKWEMTISDLQAENIQFQDLWENITLTGPDFKVEKVIVEDDKSTTPLTNFITKHKDKWPYAVGATAALTTTAVLLAKKKKGCTDSLACNFDEKAKEEDNNCKYTDCLGDCAGTALSGDFCNNRKGRYDANCNCEPRNLDCSVNDLTEGTIKVCESNASIKLIEIDGTLFELEFNEAVQEEFACNQPNSALQNGQTIKIDFYELEEAPICNAKSSKKIMVVCLEILEPKGCNYRNGSISKIYSACQGIEQYPVLINAESDAAGYFIYPRAFECSEIYQRLDSIFDKVGDNIVNLKVDYEVFNAESPCDNTIWVVLTCLEVDSTMLKQAPNPYYSKGFTPLIENRLMTIPVQNSEYPETTIIANILGIQYNQAITPTLFIENQTGVAYVPASDWYFLNNKITLNAKNPYWPIYYGLGFNSFQLIEIPNLSNWQNDLIWNVGMKVPVFKIFQLEAEVFKSFEVNDQPNFTISLIYPKGEDKP